MNEIKQLRDKWAEQNIYPGMTASSLEINNFQHNRKVCLPEDLCSFFKLINGTNEKYDKNFFEFYSINKIDDIVGHYKDWMGIPDYKDIVLTLNEPENHFVFANYLNHLYAYTIRLDKFKENNNGVFVICGDKYKQVADSFTEFIKLFLEGSQKITI